MAPQPQPQPQQNNHYIAQDDAIFINTEGEYSFIEYGNNETIYRSDIHWLMEPNAETIVIRYSKDHSPSSVGDDVRFEFNDNAHAKQFFEYICSELIFCYK